jgi:hypothetical protein
MLPKANAWPDHKTEFADVNSVERLLRVYFEKVRIWEVDEGTATTFYFQTSAPVSASTPDS